MKIRSWMVGAIAASLALTACGGTEEPETQETETTSETASETESETGSETESESAGIDKLVFGFVPSREADQLVDSADALAKVLSDALGVEVEAFVSQDYTALTEALASGQADIGAFGPLGVVRAIDQANAEFVLQSSRFGSFTYHTQYMTNDPDTYCLDEPVADEDGNLYCNGTLDADEGPVGADAIAKITADTELAYVDATSTSGYLIPALQMQELGVDISGFDFFAGGHDASVQAVYDGDVAVGLAFDDARSTISEQFPDVGEKVIVFAYSEEIPNDGFVVRSELPQDVKDTIVSAMLEYADTEEGMTVLDELYEIEGLREGDPAVLDVVRRADEELGEGFGG
jgi:phosphonate transport system substrate-binding protein